MWSLRRKKVALTYHMEFPVHHCYGDIWPAVDSQSVAAKCLETGFPRGRVHRKWACLPLTLAVAHTAQALPHFPCWLLEPRAEGRAETGSTLRRFITSAFID